MDPLVEAVYRGFCLMAAVQMRLPDEDPRATAEFANHLFDQIVPPEAREESSIPTGVITQHPDAEGFLEHVQEEATLGKKMRDDEKIAKAIAMSDTEKMEHEESEQEIAVRP